MNKLIFGLITLLVISCAENPKSEFSFRGTTNGIKNGTILYLENTSERNIIDSTTVENNSFVFETKLSKSPLQVVLRTKDHSHYRFLWLENNPMSFDGSKTDFRNANVTGSESENLSQTLHNGMDSLSGEERTKKEIEFVNNNPNSIVSANVLSMYSTT